MREDYYAGLEDRNFLTFDEAKSEKLTIDFDAKPPAPTPNKLGITVIDQVALEDVVPYMDWVCSFSFCYSKAFVLQSRNLHLPVLFCRLFYRILSFKHGSSAADTQTVVTPKFLRMKLLVVKRKSYLMTH